MARTRVAKLARLVRSPRYWAAARRGVIPSLEHARVPFQGGTRTVVDVGASRGQFAAFAAARFPDAQLICFEPLPGPRETLTEIVGRGAVIHAAAVGSERGTAVLNVSAQDDSSSLLPIGAKQVREFPGTQSAGTLEVDVQVLADLDLSQTQSPRLLKIDVQGFELDVLRGAGATLDAFDEVFVECSFVELYDGQALADEVISFLLTRGLRFAGAYGTLYDARSVAVQADLLFRR